MPENRVTSLSLVQGLIEKQDVYWARLERLYGPIISFWIVEAGVDRESALDLRQEVLLAVSKNIENYHHAEESPGSLRRWMWGIARNKIGDHWRKDYQRAVAAGGTDALGALKALPSVPFEESEPARLTEIRKELVSRAIGLLQTDFEPQTWQAFWATVVEGCSTADVSARLGMKSNAVRQARFRVLTRLREELGDDLTS